MPVILISRGEPSANPNGLENNDQAGRIGDIVAVVVGTVVLICILWQIFKFIGKRRKGLALDPYTASPPRQHHHQDQSNRRGSFNPQTQQYYATPPPTFNAATMDAPPNYPKFTDSSSAAYAPNITATQPITAADPNYHLLSPGAPPMQYPAAGVDNSPQPDAEVAPTTAVHHPPTTSDRGASVGLSGLVTTPMLLQSPSPAHTHDFRAVGSPAAVTQPQSPYSPAPETGLMERSPSSGSHTSERSSSSSQNSRNFPVCAD